MAVKVPNREVYRRVKKMMLLGFASSEMVESVQQAVGVPVDILDVEECIEYIQQEWNSLPVADEVKSSENELWQRSEMFKSDMLDLYQRTLENALATLNGEYTHKDGTPVIATKPADVAAMAEKILKIEREVVKEKRETLRTLGAAASISDTPQTNAEIFKLTEEEDEQEEDMLPPQRTEL